MAPSNFVPTIVEQNIKYASTLSLSHVLATHYPHTLGTWQGRDETGNPTQKHDVELIKDVKRWG